MSSPRKVECEDTGLRRFVAMKIVAVVMAGGLGIRLWPRSTERKPKQFVHALGEGTLIQNTVARLLPMVTPDDVYVVTTADLSHHVVDQLPMVSPERIISEPFGRNTGPAIALSAAVVAERHGSDVVMVVLPSDHVIHNVREFQVVVDQACTAAVDLDRIMTIAVMPTRPETGYGYIQVGDPIPCDNPLVKGHAKAVLTFAEKPDAATAQRFLDAGDFAWNSGIVVATAGAILRAVDEYMPDHAPLIHQWQRRNRNTDEGSELEALYRQMRSVSFDVAVLERDPTIGVVEGSFGWSDLGTWDELYRMSLKDGKNNVIEGTVMAIRTSNSLVSASSGRLVGVIDMDNIMVIETEQSVLICRRGMTENVRDLVDLLRRRQISKHF
ncbi:MAG: mannose-1-phosphate guanylyltransferase [Candidatus Kapabacteria bacterium]|nr:mannose-1-phosphate guanylyltransferase [Candidatus Kapabacteria bacterium]